MNKNVSYDFRKLNQTLSGDGHGLMCAPLAAHLGHVVHERQPT